MKTDLLSKFSADAINAPVAITGGTGKCAPKSHHSKKTKKTHKTHKTKSHKTKSHKSGGSGCSCKC